MVWRWFWCLISIACVVWYLGITWYVAFRGAKDIRDMLHTLGERKKNFRE